MPYYLPLFAAAILCFVLGRGTIAEYIGIAVLAAAVFTLYFFRDPPRRIPQEPGAVVSAADGTVVAIETLGDSNHYGGECTRVSVFLSVFNVHVNRAPTDASVQDVIYKQGAYKNAMRADSSDLNESNAIWFETDAGPITVRQISGAIARRIICLPQQGQTVTKGQKIGMIKFGSRTELYLPTAADIRVTVGQKVRGGSTIIAMLHRDAQSAATE